MSRDLWEIVEDCPHCRIASAVVSLCAARDDGGDPVIARRCRGCAWDWAADGSANTPPADLRDRAVARARLTAWSVEEGSEDVDAFCVVHLGGTLSETLDRLAQHAPIDTSFDAFVFLFPELQGGSSFRTVPSEPPAAPPTPPPPRADAPPPPPPDVHRAAGRLLASVLVADGAIRAGERAFVDAFLAREGLPPHAPSDLRVWRPQEVAVPPPADAHRYLEAAVALAHLDRMRDASEWRVLQAYARAWGVSDAALATMDARFEAQYGTVLTRLFRGLSRAFRATE